MVSADLRHVSRLIKRSLVQAVDDVYLFWLVPAACFSAGTGLTAFVVIVVSSTCFLVASTPSVFDVKGFSGALFRALFLYSASVIFFLGPAVALKSVLLRLLDTSNGANAPFPSSQPPRACSPLMLPSAERSLNVIYCNFSS